VAQAVPGGIPRIAPPRIVREGVLIGLGQAAAVLGGLVGVRLLTELLPPTVYGEVVLLTGLAALGTGLFCAPFQQALLRHYPDARNAGAVRAFRREAGRILGLGAAALAVLLVAAGALRGSGAAFAAAAALVAVDAWRSFESGLLNGERRQADYMVRTGLDAWARWLAGAALAFWLGPAALHVLVGFVLGSGVVGLALRHRIVRGKAEESSARETWGAQRRAAFLAYALPLVPLAALNWIFSMGDRYVLAASWSTAATGVYVAAYGLASQPFIAVNNMIHNTLRPVLYDAVAAGDVAKERRTLRIWIAVVVTVMVLGWAALSLLAGPLCRLLLGPAYQKASALVPLLAAAYALQGIQQTFEIMLFAHAGTKRLVALQAVAAAASLVLYLVLIPAGGARGAAQATLGTFVLTTIVAFFLADAPTRLGLRRAR